MDSHEEPGAEGPPGSRAGAMAPIFIVSCARSGSTLLRYILDTHPAIYAPPELNLGRVAASLLLMEGGLHGRRLNSDPSDYADPKLLVEVREGIVRRLDACTRQRGKTVWCEKSPQNLTYLELLQAVFPDARFICLYRNRLDTIHSCLEASRYVFLPPMMHYATLHPTSLLSAAAQYWIDGATTLMELERKLGERAHRVRYEDVVTRPAETLADLFSFLGLPWRAELIDAVYETPHDDGFGDISVRFAGGIHRDSIGGGRGIPQWRLSAEQRSRMEELDRELGYAEILAEILAVPASAPARMDETAASSDQGPRWIFETHLPARLQERREDLGVLGPSYFFSIAGEGGGAWSLCRGDDGELRVLADGQGDGVQAATSIGLDAQDLLEIAAGRLNVIKALNEGRISFTGEKPRFDQIELLVKLLGT